MKMIVLEYISNDIHPYKIEILGVFSSKEKAEEASKKYSKVYKIEYKKDSFNFEEMELNELYV